MVARKNVKPELGDSIRKLVSKVDNGSTVPHGIKAVEEDEGTAYTLPGGGSLYLDGLKLSQWDTQISEAEQALTDAQLAIDESTTALETTETRLNAMDQDLIEIRGGDIDVPGTLAAKVVQAMDIETKRLVVTEDAILNQLTVIEGIVTTDLVAQRIVISDLGYDLMQQAALVVTGPQGTVELSGSGYKAWNAQNQLTVDLNGSNNVITGDFKTAYTGTRAEITTRTNTSAIDFFVGGAPDHGGIWYDGSATRTLTIGAMPDAGFDPQTSASMRFMLEQRAIQMNAMQENGYGQQHGYFEFSNIPAGATSAETNHNYFFPLATGSKIFLYFQAETGSGARIIVTQTGVDENGFQFRAHNLSTFASGTVYIWWTAVSRTAWWL